MRMIKIELYVSTGNLGQMRAIPSVIDACKIESIRPKDTNTEYGNSLIVMTSGRAYVTELPYIRLLKAISEQCPSSWIPAD